MDMVELCPGQVEESIGVMQEVAAWGRAKGFRIWPDAWLTREVLLAADVHPENFYLGKIGGRTACAFLLQTRDSEYWGGAGEGEAVYLHKFCVRREFAGRGMTGLVIGAIKKLCKERGIRYIRLDTTLDEKTVRKIYLHAGFKIIDILDHPNGRSTALYELDTQL